MTNLRIMVEGSLIAIAASAAAPALSRSLQNNRLTATVDFFGARIGMTRAELMAHTPGRVIAKDRCISASSDDPRLLFLECGVHNLTVNFTDADTVWQLRASYDFSDTSLSIADARAALISCYGKPISTTGGGLAWLAPGAPAAKVDFCAGGAMLLAGEIESESRSGAPSGPPPGLDPHCAPFRSAILPERSGHRGVIIDVQDARPRLAELHRQRGKAAPGRR